MQDEVGLQKVACVPPKRCCIINCPTVNCLTGAVACSVGCCNGVARSSLTDAGVLGSNDMALKNV